MRNWYAKHPHQAEKNRQRTTVRRVANREWVFQYMQGKSCADCGHADIRVLDFDHLRDKKWAIADAVSRGLNLDEIKIEVTKCELVCKNCHHLRTVSRRGASWHDRVE